MEVGVQMMNGNQNAKKVLIVIQGPTASGKTGLSVSLAEKLSTVILSADSRQFYRQMSIGTAKPGPEEQRGIPHYFIDSHDLQDEVTAARFAKEAEELLKELFQHHDHVILTGGSGMFVDALCKGIDDIPTDPVVKEELISNWKSDGIESLLEELHEKDPQIYEQIDRQNPSRVIRALEVVRITGKPFSHFRTGTEKDQFFTVKRFIIEHPREILYERIEQRVDEMIEEGLIEEVKSLLPFRNSNPLRTVGYSEIFQYLDGEITLNDAIRLIKQHTRNYAKRQLTWLRRYSDANWIPFSDVEQMTQRILEEIAQK